jgi:hypothetical protein
VDEVLFGADASKQSERQWRERNFTYYISDHND